MRTTAETRDIYNRSGDKLNAVRSFDYWFKMQVQDRGPWDYKYKSDDHNLYEPFGNFNYGAVGAAAGYSLDTRYRPRTLRATMATNALNHGADIAKVQEVLGHSSIATTRLFDRRTTRPEDSPVFKVKF
jgi:integrase